MKLDNKTVFPVIQSKEVSCYNREKFQEWAELSIRDPLHVKSIRLRHEVLTIVCRNLARSSAAGTPDR